MDAAERELLEDSVRRALAADGVDPDAALDELGWPGMLTDAPEEAIAVVGRALGRANRRATVLDDVLAYALGLAARADLAIALPHFGTWDPPGADGFANGLVTARGARAQDFAIVTATSSGLALDVVPASSASLTPLAGIDPDSGFAAVAGKVDRTEPLDADRWETAVATARRVLAYEIAGATRSMLDLAREHALTREQFGRPVARFQAVRHRLAETLVAIESLDAALDAASEDPGPVTAALAKALATNAQRVAARHCQQVLAGIGFTTDHPFHRYLKRTVLLDGLFGRAEEISADLGRWLLDERRVPTLIDL
jgi:hypothetical protein